MHGTHSPFIDHTDPQNITTATKYSLSNTYWQNVILTSKLIHTTTITTTTAAAAAAAVAAAAAAAAAIV